MAAGTVFALLAWLLFASAMPRHQPAMLGRVLSGRVASGLHVAAWGALAASLATFVAAKGAAQGAIFWGATLVLSGIAWVLLLTFVPRRALAAVLGVAVALLVVP